MTSLELYIMFNDFLNRIEQRHKGNREVFINCSIRKYNNRGLPLFINLDETRKGSSILRNIKEAGLYAAYTALFLERRKKDLKGNDRGTLL